MKRHDALIGEPLALDLVNTRPADADLLDGPEGLADWLARQSDRYPELAGFDAIPAAAVTAAGAVRELVDESVTALLEGRPVPPGVVEGLNRALRAAPVHKRLAMEDGIAVVTTERSGTSAERLAAILAEAAAELLANPGIGKLKQCEADDCRLVFLQTHPRRRWCSAERCGNRVRVARYYQQNKKSS
ncbi:CGNR zinc finger domain-containing protein [Glycomyces paridis]|uniref:Zinc finger CGNR domain-containing protein n=1 Tax=Glycomyces paridis TaxID=2126555 RepID=A0A4S8PB86_9ACTN|nr:CGNR zinc finger domain-containing protein [Glycomyces paridis]THV26412.1 hypothetical protein E9998_17770 [Glycomyces paridis]